jgi:hypothetical protein
MTTGCELLIHHATAGGQAALEEAGRRVAWVRVILHRLQGTKRARMATRIPIAGGDQSD